MRGRVAAKLALRNRNEDRRADTLNVVGLSRHYIKWPHHFVVLVLEDVTVPHIAAGESFEADDDARDHAGIGADRILPAGFTWFGRHCRSLIGDFVVHPVDGD